MPCRPRSPSFFHRSAGNRLSWSICAARGAISSAAKLRTVSRSISMVSPRSKPRPGSWIMVVSVWGLISGGGAARAQRRLLELGQQPLLLRFRRDLVAFLHVAEATHALRQTGKLEGD